MYLTSWPSQVQEKEAEKKKAAQTGFAKKVNDLTRDLGNCNQDRLMYEMKRDMHSSELETLTTKLKSIDSDVATLRPQLELDSLKGRCKCTTPWCWGGGGLLLSPYKGDFTWHRISGSSMVNTCML